VATEALGQYERKENTLGARHARARLAELEP
jgi:hypothetical protein